MTKLDIKMFMYGKVHFNIESDKTTRKMTYQGKWQRLEVYHMFLNNLFRPLNRFYIRGLNGYDCMQVDTVEKMCAAALLTGYDDEILDVIDSLGKE